MKVNEDWLRERGFVSDGKGGWSKPKRIVPRVRAETVAVAQPNPEHAPLLAPQREAIYPGRIRVLVTSYCCGIQRDTDNIYVKDCLDCCRYAGIVSSDCPGTLELQVKEVRVPTKKEEGFSVEITPL